MKNESNAPNGKAHLIKALEANVRYDGRKKDEFRNIEIEFDVSNTADGSAKIKCGDTEIILGVSLTIGKPFPDRPDEGALMVACEYLPIAHPSIESGPPGIDAIETSRVIDRSIRESGSIDVKGLCIEKGEKVWIVNVDAIPLNHDGNIIDIGAIGTLAAVKKTTYPKIEDGVANYKDKTNETVKLLHTPIPITVCKVGKHLFVDPTKDEEEQIEARLTITVMENGKICSLQKGGDVSFTIEELEEAFTIAVTVAKTLVDKVN